MGCEVVWRAPQAWPPARQSWAAAFRRGVGGAARPGRVWAAARTPLCDRRAMTRERESYLVSEASVAADRY